MVKRLPSKQLDVGSSPTFRSNKIMNILKWVLFIIGIILITISTNMFNAIGIWLLFIVNDLRKK